MNGERRALVTTSAHLSAFKQLGVRGHGAQAHAVGLGSRLLDQVAQRLEGRIGRHDDDQRRGADGTHGHQVLEVVVGQLPARRGRGAHRGGREQQGVAVGRRLGHRVHPERQARAGLVLDHERLAQPGAELVAHHAGHHVGAAARRGRIDDLHRPRGPGRLRAGGPGKSECGR
jgi:hypothetical protein